MAVDEQNGRREGGAEGEKEEGEEKDRQTDTEGRFTKINEGKSVKR